MLENDDNNCSNYFSYNLQNRRKKNEDTCDEPLFYNIKEGLWSVETIKKLVALHDNYEPNPLIEETVTQKEIKEESDFLTACLNTKVMKLLCVFLMKQKLLKSNLFWEEILHEIWFKRRSGGSQTCAFQHVFLGELSCRGNLVSGVHNWVFFLLQESRNKVNYHGFDQALDFGKDRNGNERGGLITSSFEWNEDGWKYIKPYSSLFIGLSPEMELALYTLAYFLKPGGTLSVSFGGSKINIQTHTFDHRLHSAYPKFVEKKFQLNEIITINVKGKLASLNPRNGYWIIKRIDGKGSAFAHRSEMKHVKQLSLDCLLIFDIKTGFLRSMAVNIKRVISKRPINANC